MRESTRTPRIAAALVAGALFAACDSAPPAPAEPGPAKLQLSPQGAAVADGQYRLRATHSGKCVSVSNSTQGTQLRQQACADTPAQSFGLQQVTVSGVAYYRVRPQGGGLCADVSGNSTGDGAAIIQWACAADPASKANQLFELREVAAGTYTLVSRLSGKCVDVPNFSTADGAGVVQWACGGGANQRFTLAAVGTTPPPGGDLDARCTPNATLNLVDTDPARQRLVLDVTGADPRAFLQDIGRRVCRTLYKNASEVRTVGAFRFTVDYLPGQVAFVRGLFQNGVQIGVELVVSTDHLNNVKNQGRDVGAEVRGILFHEMTHVYQRDDGNDGGKDIGLIEGVADFVRYKNGFNPGSSQPSKGGQWNSGYRTTAFFLLWLDARYTDFVYRLNLSLDPNDGRRWTPEAFRTITGRSVDQLWTEYQNSI